jgi:hypothetical protein
VSVASPATTSSRDLSVYLVLLPCSLAIGTSAVMVCPVRGSLSTLAWTFAVVSAFWAMLPWSAGSCRGGSRSAFQLFGICRLLALLLGVAAGIIQSVFLGARAIFVLVELWNGFPWLPFARLTFEPGGVWTQVVLFVACAGGLITTADSRLHACTLWSTVGIALWACLLSSPFAVASNGIVERTGFTLFLLLSVGVVTMLASLTAIGPASRACSRGSDERPRHRAGWPGFHASCSVLAAILVLCVAYHLAVPVLDFCGKPGLAAALTFLVSALGAFCTLRLGIHRRIDGLTNAGLGLASLSFLSLPTVFVAGSDPRLADAYPAWFNALVFGGTIAVLAGTRVLLGLRTIPKDARAGLRPFLAPFVRRCTFLSSCLTLLIATMMAAWPRLPAIATTDDTLGRMIMGFLGCAGFAMASAYSAMRLGGWSFHLVTVLSLITAAGFVWARIIPFSG